jgi:hypothetical protein
MPTVSCLQVRFATIFDAPMSAPARLTINDPIAYRDETVSECLQLSVAASPNCDILMLSSAGNSIYPAKTVSIAQAVVLAIASLCGDPFAFAYVLAETSTSKEPYFVRHPSRRVFPSHLSHASNTTSTSYHDNMRAYYMYRTWQPSTKLTSTTAQSILSRRSDAALAQCHCR